MAGIISSGVNYVKSLIPPAGTVERTIFYLFLPFGFQNVTDRHRTGATYATLGLQGRLSKADAPFTKWMAEMNHSLAHSAKEEPTIALFNSQLFDLICKVIVSAGFYATSHISLYSTLTHLLSHSQKASNVAQPILDRIASMPIPRPLQAARVIAFLPVIVKLIHMALLTADPKGENTTLDLLKKGADKVGRGLEALWCLRFSLISLGISKNIYQSVVSTLFIKALDYFVTLYPRMAPIHLTASLIKLNAGEDPQGYKYFLNLLLGKDSFLPTKGFEMGLSGMWSALFASSAPCDLEVLEQLYTRISTTEINPANIDAIRQIRLAINDNVQNGKINSAFAEELEKLIIKRGVETILAIQDLSDQCKKDSFTKAVQEICVPTYTSENANRFVEALTLLSQKPPTTVEELDRVLRGYVLKSLLESEIASYIRDMMLRKIVSVPATFSTTWEHMSALNILADPQLSSRFYDKLDQLVTTLDLQTLNADEESSFDKSMLQLPSCPGKPEQRERAYFIAMRYHINRLNTHLKWYLENQPDNKEKQIACENLLLRLASRFDTSFVGLFPSYKKRTPGADVQQFVWESKDFDFARDTVQIPANFQFATFNLPYVLGRLSRGVNATQDRWTSAQNFPAGTCDNLTANAFPSADLGIAHFIQPVTTHEIKKAAQD